MNKLVNSLTRFHGCSAFLSLLTDKVSQVNKNEIKNYPPKKVDPFVGMRMPVQLSPINGISVSNIDFNAANVDSDNGEVTLSDANVVDSEEDSNNGASFVSTGQKRQV